MLLEQEWAKTHSCLLSHGDNKQECFMPCGGVESVADATRRRRGNPASRILFQVCYRDEDVAGDNTDN